MAFNFYFAGTSTTENQDFICNMCGNILRSYINDKRSIAELIEKKKNKTWDGNLLIDSGAFTVHRKGSKVDVDAYIEFLNTNKEYIYKAIQLDDIPGVWGQVKTIEQVMNSPIKTWENYLYMVNKLEKPEMLLPVFHQGENFEYLKQMLAFKYKDGSKIDYICISGNKERTAKERKDWYAKVFDVIIKSDNAQVKTHCLGSATFTDMEEFPFTSSDATSWLMTSINGGILTPYGSILVSDVQKHDKKHILNMPKPCIDKITEMCTEYSIPLDELRDSYIARSNFNCRYTYNKSQETTYKPRNLKRGGLF